MYKHTFYYFLGNKKYPEIYILQWNDVLLASVRLRVAGIFVSISTKCLKEGKVMWDRLVNVPLDQGAPKGRLPEGIVVFNQTIQALANPAWL